MTDAFVHNGVNCRDIDNNNINIFIYIHISTTMRNSIDFLPHPLPKTKPKMQVNSVLSMEAR